jgi:TRAP-type C4-dicarboxylate transport system substrate-binding protein
VDLKNTEGRQIIYDLVKRSDVLLTLNERSRKMKKHLTIACCLGLVFLFLLALGPAPAFAGKKLKWKMDTFQPIGHPNTLMFEKFAKLVTEKTGGRLQIKVYAASALGYKGTETLRVIKKGFIDMGDATYAILAGDFPVAAINNLPFFATDYDAARKVNEATIDMIKEELDKKFNAVVAYTFTWPTQHLFANFKAERIKDWTGKKVRGYSAETAELIKVAGGTPVTMPLPEVYTSLSRKVIDGFITGSINIKPYKFYEVTKYTNVGSFCVVGPSHVVVNKGIFNALPDDIKTIVKEVGKQMEAEHWEMVEKKDAEWLAELKTLGMKEVIILPDEIAKLRELSKPLWLKWAKKNAPAGPRVLEAARKALGM